MRLARLRIPAAIFVVTALVYAITAGPRTSGPSPNNHYAHLAQSWLNGELGVLGGRPPGFNDWACFDAAHDAVCPPNALYGGTNPDHHWYVSFPPFPAVVLAPFVAVFGLDFPDPLVWAIFAGLAPAFLFVLLRRLREEEISPRTVKEELVLVAIFAFGSVYYFTAVQGSVWFSAHIVASLLLVLFLLFAIGLKHPLGAGIALGLCFLTRPSTAPFALFFLLEAIRTHRDADSDEGYLKTVDWKKVVRSCAIFAAPILVCGGLAMWHNQARFGDPFEFGHTYLMIRWRPRIEKWGLFNLHYFSKNLAVFLASLPWISAVSPYLTISRHGLALWFTSPNLLAVLWPKKVNPLMVGLFATTVLVAFWDLCYQNSGWVQFGYRFSLDYMPMLILLLALGGRSLTGKLPLLALVFAIVVNTFGAITFDRVGIFYDDDATQDRLFQPD